MLEEKKDFKENKPLMFLVPVFCMMMCITCIVLVQQCIMSFTNDGNAIISYAKSGDRNKSPSGVEKSGEGDLTQSLSSFNPVYSKFVHEEMAAGNAGVSSFKEDKKKKPKPKAKAKFSPIVGESAAVSDEYFKNSLFMGDSRTEGFRNLCGKDIEGASYITDIGIHVYDFFEKKVIIIKGKKYTMAEALAKGKYNKVYLMFGVNDVGCDVNSFIKYYADIIREVKKTQPDAVIYVQSILQCTKGKPEEKDSNGKKMTYFGKKNISNFNRLLKELAKDEKVYFLNINKAVVDEKTGVLPDNASIDGVHLNPDYCRKWLQYLKTHTVSE